MGLSTILQQSMYLNNIVEMVHRADKGVVERMLGYKSFHCARCVIASIEAARKIKKSQLDCTRFRTAFWECSWT